jgi:Flp pilus assembly protein TadG
MLLRLGRPVAAYRRQRDEAGQSIVIFAGALVAILAVLALVIDTGNVWANQRMVQNGSDAAAEAGAVVMAQRLAGVTTPGLGWDGAVDAQVQALLDANGLTRVGAYYTDICGIPLKSDGTASLNPDNSQNLATAAAVGSGIPSSSATNPDCPNRIVGPPAGVLVVARKDVGTYVARVVGINNFSPTTQATAVSGWITGLCPASAGAACTLLPITVPVNTVSCDKSGNAINTNTPWTKFQIYKVPLCGNSPGNIGWIDWTPPAGGSSEIADEIDHPNNPPIDLPSWQYVDQAGDPNSTLIEDALRRRDGQIVMIPLFDLTCNPNPGNAPDNTKPAVETGPNYGCPAGKLGGNGSNQWYRFPSFASFMLCSPTIPECQGLHGSYVQGNNKPICDTGNGATGCLVGAFVDFITTGTVTAGSGGGSGGTKNVGVQLIR